MDTAVLSAIGDHSLPLFSRLNRLPHLLVEGPGVAAGFEESEGLTESFFRGVPGHRRK